MEWDMRILSEEQTLIQPLYDGVSAETRSRLDQIARQKGLPGLAADVLPTGSVESSRHVRGGPIPGFTGTSLTSIHERWLYGMTLGNLFTPGGTGFNPATHQRPAPSSGYANGTELARVRTRPNLHRLDAALDGGSTGATWLQREAEGILRRLTRAEQIELLRDRTPDGQRYSEHCRVIVSRPVMLSLVTSWRINLEAQMRFLHRYLYETQGAWSSVGYGAIASMIRAFDQASRSALHTPEWQRIFVYMCSDDSMLEAVRDLGLPEPRKKQWVAEERRWFH
jgi:hypothetical protein